MSEGNIHFWGQQEAEDIHDTIEWVSAQPWCNGSIGIMGNSWLAIAQMHYASRLAHPALEALAPLEGFTDPYRDLVARGGIPQSSKFNDFIMSGFAGPNKAENMAKMIDKRPLYNDYWASKNIHTENVDVPMYLLASDSIKLHSRGSVHAFRTAKTADKWLRVHPTHEWYDLYQPETLEILHTTLTITAKAPIIDGNRIRSRSDCLYLASKVAQQRLSSIERKTSDHLRGKSCEHFIWMLPRCCWMEKSRDLRV